MFSELALDSELKRNLLLARICSVALGGWGAGVYSISAAPLILPDFALFHFQADALKYTDRLSPCGDI